eukprot:jgi/Pico_ML_1/52662/g3337.t1
MMILWDQVFESTCEDESVVHTIQDVARQGSHAQDASQATRKAPAIPVPTEKEVNALLRAAGDKSTIVDLIGAPSPHQVAAQTVVDLNVSDQMGGPYQPDQGELVLFLAMNFQGLNIVGADVVVESAPGTLKTKMDLGF